MPDTPKICMDDKNSDLMAPEHLRRYRTPSCYYNIIGKPLSDKRIAYYQNKGWYKAENKEARKKRAEARHMKQQKKDNFREGPEGRLIYCP